jgi:hypothetical protein
VAGHENCKAVSRAYTEVTCDRCARTFLCTPSSDFYCAAEGDHCCEPCLINGRELIVIDPRNN